MFSKSKQLAKSKKNELNKSFIKHDQNKLQYSLIPPEATKALAEVLTFGANKYGKNNWQLCKDTTRYVDAAMRHFEAYRAGELTDKESGLSHLSHLITNISFLIHFDTKGITK